MPAPAGAPTQIPRQPGVGPMGQPIPMPGWRNLPQQPQDVQQGNPTNPQMLNLYQMGNVLGQQGQQQFGRNPMSQEQLQNMIAARGAGGLTPQRLAFMQQFGLPTG